MALTDPKIKQAKPKDKDYKLSDSKGLYLLVSKTGAKYWRLKYRFLRKEKVLALGVYPTVTLKQARKACDTAKEQLEQGIDPAQARKAKKAELTEAQSNNLETSPANGIYSKLKSGHRVTVTRCYAPLSAIYYPTLVLCR
jgi:hypothetical protein